MEQVKPTKYVSCTQAAVLIRSVLKTNFPGVKFSVKSDSYAGGASIRIGWIDGPTARQVDKAVAIYKGADFDGMTDMKSYNRVWQLEDGTYSTEEKDGAHPVHFGADYIFTNRNLTRAILEPIAARVARYWHLPEPEIVDSTYEPGTASFASDWKNGRVHGQWTLGELAQQEARRAFLSPAGLMIEKEF